MKTKAEVIYDVEKELMVDIDAGAPFWAKGQLEAAVPSMVNKIVNSLIANGDLLVSDDKKAA